MHGSGKICCECCEMFIVSHGPAPCLGKQKKQLYAVGVMRSFIFQSLGKGTLRATPSAGCTLPFFPSFSGGTRAVSLLQTTTLSFLYPAASIYRGVTNLLYFVL